MSALEKDVAFSILGEISQERLDRVFWGFDFSLPQVHRNRIAFLTGVAAIDFSRKVLYKVPGYSIAAESSFAKDDVIDSDGDISEEYEDVERRIRKWLFLKGIPFSCMVHLVQHEKVFRMEWKIFLKYFPDLTGYFSRDTVVVDATKQWVLNINHEGRIIYQCY